MTGDDASEMTGVLAEKTGKMLAQADWYCRLRIPQLFPVVNAAGFENRQREGIALAEDPPETALV